MLKFLIIGDKFFNKMFLWSILIFIGFCLGGCQARQPNPYQKLVVAEKSTTEFKEKTIKHEILPFLSR